LITNAIKVSIIYPTFFIKVCYPSVSDCCSFHGNVLPVKQAFIEKPRHDTVVLHFFHVLS